MTSNDPKKPHRKRKYLEIAGEVLEGAIPLASALVQLRDKPRMPPKNVPNFQYVKAEDSEPS